MKLISSLLNKNFLEKKKAQTWDEKSIFFAFERIIKEEFGNQGVKNLTTTYLKNKRLFVEYKSSIWASELNLNKEEIKNRINKELGSEEVWEIKIK
jgi:hypothetical protein